jgi:tRNA 2-thiocytidine biosynthesis protein TtcA
MPAEDPSETQRNNEREGQRDAQATKKSGQALERRILKATGEAVADFSLIEDGDRILVGLSGGKDSYTLLHVLRLLQQRAPVKFELFAVNMNPGYADYQPEVVRQWAEEQGVEIHLLKASIEALVAEKIKPGQAACPLCSRIRRGAFYSLCQKEGFNKLALGHHLDDAVETLLINLLYAGVIRSMAPKLAREEPPEVIRPLSYVLERDISAYCTEKNFPVIPCASPHCGASDRRRQVIKGILHELEKEHADIKTQMRRAMRNVDAASLFDIGLLRNLGALKS